MFCFLMSINSKQRCLIFQAVLAQSLWWDHVSVSCSNFSPAICHTLASWSGVYMCIAEISWVDIQHLSSHDIFQIHKFLNYCMTSCVYTHHSRCHCQMCGLIAEKNSENHIQQQQAPAYTPKLGCSCLKMSISILEKLFSAQIFWDGIMFWLSHQFKQMY